MVTWRGISRLPGFCYSCSWMSARSIQEAIPGFRLLFHQMAEAQSQELLNWKQLSLLVVVVVSEKMCCDSVLNLIFSSIRQVYSRRIWDHRGSRRAGWLEWKVDPPWFTRQDFVCQCCQPILHMMKITFFHGGCLQRDLWLVQIATLLHFFQESWEFHPVITYHCCGMWRTQIFTNDFVCLYWFYISSWLLAPCSCISHTVVIFFESSTPRRSGLFFRGRSIKSLYIPTWWSNRIL
jgi:hypothetical protein